MTGEVPGIGSASLETDAKQGDLAESTPATPHLNSGDSDAQEARKTLEDALRKEEAEKQAEVQYCVGKWMELSRDVARVRALFTNQSPILDDIASSLKEQTDIQKGTLISYEGLEKIWHELATNARLLQQEHNQQLLANGFQPLHP